LIVLLFGPPGCGKGTQAALIAERFAIPSFSTGEMLRCEIRNGTELGRRAAAILASGGLVGDDIVNHMVAQRLAQPGCAQGFLLDGYPRTVAQAHYLTALLTRLGFARPIPILVDVPNEAIVTRITARRYCPACARIYNLVFQPPRRDGVCDADGTPLLRRQDDTAPVVLDRLEAYGRATGPMLGYYHDDLRRVDGNRPPAAVASEVLALLAAPAEAHLAAAAR